MQFPKGVQIGTLHGDVASNTVVMWTDKANDTMDKYDQAPIISPIAHRIPFSQHHLYYKHVSPIVQLDVADVQEIDDVPVVADFKPHDNEIELFKVPPPCRSLCHIPILSSTHASTTTRRRPCTEWSRPSNMMVSSSPLVIP